MLTSLSFLPKIANCLFDVWNTSQGMEKMLCQFTQIGGVVADAVRNV